MKDALNKKANKKNISFANFKKILQKQPKEPYWKVDIRSDVEVLSVLTIFPPSIPTPFRPISIRENGLLTDIDEADYLQLTRWTIAEYLMLEMLTYGTE